MNEVNQQNIPNPKTTTGDINYLFKNESEKLDPKANFVRFLRKLHGKVGSC